MTDTAAAPSAQGNGDNLTLWDEELKMHVLQAVVFNSRGFVLCPQLYMGELAGRKSMRGEAMFLAAGAKMGWNTYGNSFFASYWEAMTNLEGLILAGKLEGQGLVHLFRSTTGGAAIKIGEYPVSGVFSIDIDLFSYMPSDDGAGRIFFDFEATGDALIHKLAFGTLTPPLQMVRFSLGICTYRKERHVTNLALGLEAYIKRGGKALDEVIIVSNEGTGASLPILQKIAERTPAFTLRTQDNIGGAGGFARSLHISQKSDTSTHHIFMDDDVFLDTNMLDRLQAFVSYCHTPHIVGGQMMNMEAPNIVYEGGATLDYWGFLNRVGSNINGGLGQEVSFFDKYKEVDYNAWWFACVPKEHARRVGLPLNIFIRGDDFEYGLRLKYAGVPTVSLPGLFLWHEPFEGKISDWLEYYNFRNRLIVTAVYSGTEDFGVLPANTLRDVFTQHMGGDQNRRLLAIVCGVLDFLRGPEAVLKSSAQTLHKDMMNVLAGSESDPDYMAAYLEQRLADLDAGLTLNPMFGLANTAFLGGRARTVQNMPWRESPLVPLLETVIAQYIETAHAVAAEWRSKAHGLSTDDAWTALYNWEGR